MQNKVLKHVINKLSSELTDAECSGIASGSASCSGKPCGGVTVGCICGGKHLGGVIVGDTGGGNGGGNGDSVGGNGDLMIWPFLAAEAVAAAAFAAATSFLNRPVLFFPCFVAGSNSRAGVCKSSW